METGKRKPKYKVKWKIIWLGMLSFAAFMYATTYAHELGHAAVCASEGYQWILHVNPYTFETRAMSCSDRPDNNLLYSSLGGIMGMVVAGVPYVVLRKYKLIVIGTLPHVLAHAITGSMETFVHDWYINTELIPHAIASVPMLVLVMHLLFRYAFVKLDSPIQAQP